MSHRGNVFALVTSVASDQETAKQSYSLEMIQSQAVEEEREVVVKVERLAPEETWGSPEILPVLERVADDWFVLFQVIPRKTTYVSPGTAELLCFASVHSRNHEDFYPKWLHTLWDCVSVVSEELHLLL